jgi:hypothetical protein
MVTFRIHDYIIDADRYIVLSNFFRLSFFFICFLCVTWNGVKKKRNSMYFALLFCQKLCSIRSSTQDNRSFLMFWNACNENKKRGMSQIFLLVKNGSMYGLNKKWSLYYQFLLSILLTHCLRIFLLCFIFAK